MEEEQERGPLGIFVLGGLNCFVFGLLFLIIFTSIYFKATPQDLGKAMEVFETKGIPFEITFEQFKLAIGIHIITFLIFLVSGAGLLLRKEWARKLTIYFSFFIVVFTVISTLAQPSLIKQAIIQVIYPGILIVYFTNKNIERYFAHHNTKNIKNPLTN